jgi:hypothetical protein
MMRAECFACGAPSGGVFRVPLTTAQREDLQLGGPDPFATIYVPVCAACGARAEQDPDFGARFDAAVIHSARTDGHRGINLKETAIGRMTIKRWDRSTNGGILIWDQTVMAGGCGGS